VRLLIDLQACQGPSGTRGIGYYARSLTQALASARGSHEIVVLVDGAQPPDEVLALRQQLSPSITRDGFAGFPAPPRALRAHGLPEAEAAREAAIAALQPDVVLVSSIFELARYAPMSVNEWCADRPTAAVLYDLIPLGDLDAHKPDRGLREEYLRGVDRLSRMDALLAISDYTAAEARRLLPGCPPITTVHGAAPDPASPRAPRSAPAGGFGLAVGLHEPRKDIRTAVLAWARLPRTVRQGRPFVVVGGWPEDERERLRQEAAAAGLARPELLFLGAATDEELAWAYANAHLFAFPSLVEGLGLPPLEAAHAGTPVLLARSSSLVELLDDEKAYVAPGDIAELSARMALVLTDQGVRDDLVAAGDRAVERFTWARTAELAWRALEQVRPRPVAHAPVTVEVLGRAAVELRAALSGGVEVAPGVADVVVHVLPADGHWEEQSAVLAERPGVVVLPPLDDVSGDLSALLAPALGVVVSSPEDASRALELGVVSAPVAVVPESGAGLVDAVHAAWRSDVATHWAAALTPSALDPQLSEPLLNRPVWSNRPRGLLLGSDVTVYRSTGFLSGIQRATRRLHTTLAASLRPIGGAVVPVSFAPRGEGTAHPTIASDPVLAAVEARPGDVDWVLCLDLDDQLVSAQADLQAVRAGGVGVATNVFDLLPWAHPEWWPPGAAAASFIPWAKAALRVSDVLLVNSVATATELQRFVETEGLRRPDLFEVQLLRLGADLGHDEDHQESGRSATREADHFLMVGTVEPRKGHREVLDAFEGLWSSGSRARLTVLGRAGWMVDDVVDRMEGLAASQPRFQWLRNATDAQLDGLYATCTAVLVASEAEGFGLPVVEAAVRGCPVVVRDIPVLRELAGDGATYFGGQQSLITVLQQVARDGAAVPSLERVHTWEQVGQRLLDILEGGVPPLARWSPADGWAWT
jgi:glycosyltransferase involved in cell wall biosynthesis